MSIGRRGDKTYTGPNGVPTDRLRELDKLRTPGSGIDGRHAPPSTEALRKYIKAETCPWCGAGPFKNLACHTNRSHGVSADEFRELAGLKKTAPLCSEEYSQKCAERRPGQPLPPAAYERCGRTRRTYSEAGRAVQRAKAAKQPQANRDRAARISGDKQLAANAAKHAEILRLYADGVPMLEIASAVGVSPPTVSRTLKREGVYVDGRTRRWRKS